MHFVTRYENNSITYFLADDFNQASEIYQREKLSLISKFGMSNGYSFDNRDLDNGDVVETIAVFHEGVAELRTSAETDVDALQRCTTINELCRLQFSIVDERKENKL